MKTSNIPKTKSIEKILKTGFSNLTLPDFPLLFHLPVQDKSPLSGIWKPASIVLPVFRHPVPLPKDFPAKINILFRVIVILLCNIKVVFNLIKVRRFFLVISLCYFQLDFILKVFLEQS